MKCYFAILLFLSFYNCSKETKQTNYQKPSYIEFVTVKDSLHVIIKNKLKCPIYGQINNLQTNDSKIVHLKTQQDSVIMRFSNNETDSSRILKNFRFKAYYGDYNVKTYDTNFSYKLPFIKGYKSKIIQGNDGRFTHSGKSSKAIDFIMKVGDTVSASREGTVVAVVKNHNKHGRSKKYQEFANYILVYHKDNTFGTYVHLKKNGSLVKIGDSVKTNQPIGIIGLTGQTTEPHLHFEVSRPTISGLQSIPIKFGTVPAKKLTKGITVNKIEK